VSMCLDIFCSFSFIDFYFITLWYDNIQEIISMFSYLSALEFELRTLHLLAVTLTI
jgi:hypothetical protein